MAGFCNFQEDYTLRSPEWTDILNRMKEKIKHRGPDDNGIYLTKHAGLAHARLSIIDLANGRQPMTRKIGNKTFTIIYNGELYNTAELRTDLEQRGLKFLTTSDTEVILLGIMEYGNDYVKQLNGIFAFAIWDEYAQTLSIFRDRLGIKPLFYTLANNTLVFGSELKVLFEYPDCRPIIDKQGLCEVFGLGPAKTYGSGVFKNCFEVLPGCYNVFHEGDFKSIKYWELVSRPHTDSYEETIEKTSFLVRDSIKRQMVSDIPICTFLSGGVDSSIVTAVCAGELAKLGEQLNTFSFDFDGNDQFFKANSFQPSRDRPYVDMMVKYLKTNHKYLECDNLKLADYLYTSVDAKDLPGMADVDSSLLYFCSEVKKYNNVTLTGECADEIFGGYPWFHNKESFERNTFPWSINVEPRKQLLKDSLLQEINLEEYILTAYDKSVHETPRLEGESELEARRREIAFLNIKWFMITLLDRMDRTSMYSGLEARVPLADHRILEYVWNVPWDIKCRDGVVKHLLRESAKGLLPEEVLYRKKSPYPKTYNPNYEKLLSDRLMAVLKDSSSPINALVDIEKVSNFISTPSDYGKPWFGQLMAGPQMLAYLLQVNYWLDKFKIEVQL
ncbi:asparagine synthase (glutamine-hydrolyzing) [Anaerocolumna sp. AGMB13025]|nr:asparagine synthase (glutamine-hydrolyzing) [Anaerocolumna sp. AGMB13025]WFR60193.1 asparagine synthase (glutamine-hydrolyzing) [Anaerocolumna sp. AGMB13025]